MDKKKVIMFVLLGGCISVTAQHYCISDVRDVNAWLTTDNAATLISLDVPHVSEAEVGLKSESGGFRDFRSPRTFFTVDANVESYYRILPRLVGYGRMSYQNTSMHQVAGSSFIDSSRMPFDIVEDSTTNEGNAHKDVYNIVGGLSYAISPRLSIGGKVDFTAANYAKYKDLRHKNSLTDITATAGLFLPLASWFKVGGNVYYRRTIEGVTHNIYGSEDKVYRSLIDYGILTGEVTTFGENGYTEKGTEIPFVSEQKGLSLQLGTSTNDSIFSLVGEFSYRKRKGYYGRDTDYSAVYNRHHGDVYEVNTVTSYKKHNDLHQLIFALEVEGVENDATTFLTVQDRKTSAHYYEYYAPVKMSNKLWVNYSVGYRAFLAMRGRNPLWMVECKLTANEREQTAYFYPYKYHQHLKSKSMTGLLLRNVNVKDGILGIKGTFAYRWGRGNVCEETVLATPSDKQKTADVMQAYRDIDYHTFVAPQYSVGLDVKYSKAITKANLDAYVQISSVWRHANGLLSDYFEGKNRYYLGLSVGTRF